MAFEDGPFIQAACFCNMVIEDKTSTLSLFRIIDNFTRTITDPSPPMDMPPTTFQAKLVLMLKSGKARGRGDIVIRMEEPSGISNDMMSLSVHFEGEDKGQNLIANMNITFNQEGLYWFHVLLDEEKLTSIPFRVKYSRITTGLTQPPQ